MLHAPCDATAHLPVEILASIFTYVSEWNLLQQCVPVEYYFDFPEEERSTELIFPIIGHIPALSLSSTCFRWRGVVNSCPNIWSRLKLEINTRRSSLRDDALIATLELLLSRSGQYPLTIDLNFRGANFPMPLVDLVGDILCKHSSRWRSFRFRGDGFIRNRPPVPMDLSLLEILDLHWDSTQSRDIVLFQNAPRIRTLSLVALRDVGRKFEQITSLSTGISSYFPMNLVLDLFPNVTSLELLGQSNGLPCIATSWKVVDTLIVQANNCIVNGHSMLEQTFGSFIFPCLKKIHICHDQRRCGILRAWPTESFVKFLSRSGCNITTLIITAMGYLSDTDLISALRLESLSSLVTLELSDVNALPKFSPISSRFISSLRTASGPLVPRLRHLSLELGGHRFDDQAFVEAVSLRWLPDIGLEVDCLRSVVLRFHVREVIEKTVYAPLQGLDRMGLRVVVRDINGIIV